VIALGAGAGAATVGASVGGALAVGVTVVTVSGVNGAAGAGADGVVAAGGALVVAGWLVVTGGATVVDTDPLSPPPRITTVQITATSRIAPATPGDPDPSPIDRLVVVVVLVLFVVLDVSLETVVFAVPLVVEVDCFAAVVPMAGNPFGGAQGIR